MPAKTSSARIGASMRATETSGPSVSHWQENAPLYGAAFFQSLGMTIWGLTMPLILKSLGATDGVSGTVCSLYNWLYLVACLSAVAVINRFHPKPLLTHGSSIVAASSGVILLTIVLHSWSVLPVAPIPIITIFVALMGAATALFWPPLMSWISDQHAGAELNRRLGAFSVSWSTGALAAPLISSYAIALSNTWAQGLAFAFSAAAWLCILLAKRSASHQPHDNETAIDPDAHLPVGVTSEQARAYQWMSRIALLAVFVPIGALRTHLPILLTYDLGYSTLAFGLIMTAFSIVQTTMYAVIGRTHRWHYHPAMFWGAQLVMAGAFAALAIVTSIPAFIVMAAALAAMHTFIYASHLYYGVSGGAKRSRVTTIHELTLSAGYAFGAMAAGMISDALGRRAPYACIAAAVIIGIIAQVFVRPMLMRKRPTPTT
jgi:MFS family permease